MSPRARRILMVVGAIVLAFLAGFVWQYARAWRLASELRDAREALAWQRLENTLATATIEAQRGSHESARRLASEFFAGLQENVDGMPAAQAVELRSILAERDAVITALARGEPEADEMLADQFSRLRAARGGADAALSPAGSRAQPSLPTGTPRPASGDSME